MSDEDSVSSDDLPLAALGTKDESSSDEEEFEDEDEDEDEEIGGEESDSDDFIVEDSDEGDEDGGGYTSDSSDDAPLTSLKSKKVSPPKKSKAKKLTKKKTPVKKAAPKKKSLSAKKEKSNMAISISATNVSNWFCASNELYTNCDKGKLIQSLLARWWYAYEWPDPKSYEEGTPNGYDALDGFPGVYVGTRGSEVGKILDRRDHSKSPSFNNFARKDSKELKELLLMAIEEQFKVLIKHEGKGTDTEKNLRVLETWAMRLNCNKADKDAAKVLKAKRLTLS